jgi:predicted lipoprotein with Yx(FWY)xxD motif
MSRIDSRKKRTVRIASTIVIGGGLATALGVASASGAPHDHSKNVVVSVLKSAKFGTILTDGMTLYTLKPTATSCTATCHKYWIPLLLPKGDTKAVAGTGVSATKLGTVKVKAGRQVTYNGKALFWFFEDKSAGQVKGNVTDTWGKWADVVLTKPASKPATTTTKEKATTTTTLKSTTTTVPAAPAPTTTTPSPVTTTTAPGGGGGVGF